MKVTFIGTGTMGSTTRCNTSILVDDMLFDIGMGTVKQIERLQIYTKNINYIVISHFHADHFLDIPNLLIGRKIRKETNNLLYIIGPKGVRQKTFDLLTFTHSDGDIHKYDNLEEKYNCKFIELNNNEEFRTDTFKLRALELDHGNCKPVNGYILEKDGKKIAYATDTTFCDNYYNMCSEVSYIFSDVTRLDTTPMHIGLNEYKELYKKYPNCNFYAVHRSDYNTEEINTVEFPNDGDILEI